MRTFFVPAHITGFFEIREHEDPLKTGSRGSGVVLDKGVSTGVVVRDSDENSMKVFYDDKECRCPTTRSVVREMLQGTCGVYEVEVHHFPELPLEYGFGLSASGALGAALALNHALELEYDHIKLGKVAHKAEVRNRTGLGDVIAELSRSLVTRTKEGAPGMGKIKSVPLECSVVCFIIGKRLRTKTVLDNRTKRLAVNVIGKKCVNEMLKNTTRERFMELSKRFTIETGLAQSRVEKAIKTLEKLGIDAAMCMLGHAVFTLTDEPERVVELLDYPSIITRPLEKDIRNQEV
jgi:pantoate kinase